MHKDEEDFSSQANRKIEKIVKGAYYLVSSYGFLCQSCMAWTYLLSTTPLGQWGFRQCLPFSWTTLRSNYCRHPRNGTVMTNSIYWPIKQCLKMRIEIRVIWQCLSLSFEETWEINIAKEEFSNTVLWVWADRPAQKANHFGGFVMFISHYSSVPCYFYYFFLSLFLLFFKVSWCHKLSRN